GEPKRNLLGLEEGDLDRRRTADANFARLRAEQVRGRWYAALVSLEPDDELAIRERFGTREDMNRRLQERNAVVEVWAYGPGGDPLRRLPARELSERARQPNPAPTYLTATFPNLKTGALERCRLEFGFYAADRAAREGRSYRAHRIRQEEIHRILGSRDRAGALSAFAQWDALRSAARSGRLSLSTLPPKPSDDQDPFVAFE
ncbi:MAG: hypothetical protein GWO24_03350, partial [Akkermansiaceae bacterium]|nr:hypothetical protein [Akkermansiaceae bacterium]